LKSLLVTLSLTLAALLPLGCGGISDPVSEIEQMQADGHWADTLAPLARMVDADPDNPVLNRLYGVALMETGDFGLAVWPLQKAARAEESGQQVAVLLLARAFMMSGNYDDGLAKALEVLETDPDSIEALSLAVQGRLSLNLEAEALADIEVLMELEPKNTIPRSWYVTALIGLGRLEEADQAFADLRALSEQGAGLHSEVAARLCSAHAVFSWKRGEIDAAVGLFDGCLDRWPADYNVVSKALEFFDEGGLHGKATALLRVAHLAEPEIILYRASLAERLQVMGQGDEAENILVEGTREYPSFETWSSLANFYIAAESFPEASRAVDEAVALHPEPPPTLRLMQADLWIEVGRLGAARELAGELDSPLKEMLIGKILLEEGRPAEALEALEVGIQLWPNNALARYLAARAAQQLGDFDRAISEYRDSLRADAAYTDAGLRLSRLQRRLRDYGGALAAIRMHVEAHPDDLEGRLEMLRVTHQTGPAELMTRSVSALSQLPGQVGRALAESTDIIAGASGAIAARESIEESGLDLELPINVDALAAWARYTISAGDAAVVLERVDRLLVESPNQPALHESRARALIALGAPANQIVAAYLGALESGGERVDALIELAAFQAGQGRRDESIGLYDRATRADPEDSRAAWAAIELLRVEGSGGDAQLEGRLEDLLRADPLHARAALTLARMLLEREQDLERAEALTRRSIRIRETPIALGTLATLRLKDGGAQGALALVDRGLEALPESGPLHYRRGQALLALGRPEEARAAFERALKASDFEEVEAARAELAALARPSE